MRDPAGSCAPLGGSGGRRRPPGPVAPSWRAARELEHDGGPAAGLLPDPDRAPVRIHDRAGDREPETGARAPLAADEGFEDAVPLLSRDPRSGVRDPYLHAVPPPSGTDRDPSAGR